MFDNMLESFEKFNLEKQQYYMIMSSGFIKKQWKLIYGDYNFAKRYETPDEFIEAIKQGNEYILGFKVILDDPEIEDSGEDFFKYEEER